LIEEALRRFVASEHRFLVAVDAGLRDIEAGRVVAHATVMAEIDALLDGFPDDGPESPLS
jgi:predicted transcriptional regulator